MRATGGWCESALQNSEQQAYWAGGPGRTLARAAALAGCSELNYAEKRGNWRLAKGTVGPVAVRQERLQVHSYEAASAGNITEVNGSSRPEQELSVESLETRLGWADISRVVPKRVL